MGNYLNLQIPVFAAYLDTAFFNDELPNVENERVPVEVFVYTSIPQRCGMFSVMTEYGSQHARGRFSAKNLAAKILDHAGSANQTKNFFSMNSKKKMIENNIIK